MIRLCWGMRRVKREREGKGRLGGWGGGLVNGCIVLFSAECILIIPAVVLHTVVLQIDRSSLQAWQSFTE